MNVASWLKESIQKSNDIKGLIDTLEIVQIRLFGKNNVCTNQKLREKKNNVETLRD